MKLKINKACDLSSISVLPPPSRRTSAITGGLESSSIYAKSQMAGSQLRSQQPQLSQQSFSQGVSSQHGLFSQFSQNSQDDVLTSEKLGSQERENSAKRTLCLPPVSFSREESQMMVSSRTSGNFMRKWSGSEYKCQINEELEHRIGMIETSLNRLGMILESVQNDVMQVNKGTKEVILEMDGVRQKLIVYDDTLQLMNKGQEDIKGRIDMGINSLADQLKQNNIQENLREMLLTLSSIPEKINTQIMNSQTGLRKDFSNEIQAMVCSMKVPIQKQTTPPIHGPALLIPEKAPRCHAPPQEVQFPYNVKKQAQELSFAPTPKVEMGGWKTVKHERTTSKAVNLNTRRKQIKVSPVNLVPKIIVIDSDEDIDGGFSCLLKEKGTEVNNYLAKEAEEETARILRKARRRKRKHNNTIIIN